MALERLKVLVGMSSLPILRAYILNGGHGRGSISLLGHGHVELRAETTRDILQLKLLGPLSALGTGYDPW